MELVSIFTKNLRHYLKEHEEHGRTFTDICREAPFPKGTLGTLTSGRVDNPTYNTAYKLAQAMWVPMEAFAVRTAAARETHCRAIRARHKENRLIEDIYAKADERKKQ
jgi:hypothetical protein